ncbi:hypothetical protein SCACP_21110 [Sporomusa carbonis]|uniref:DUF1638 domain-containing protein n=1 Tax=Sporomusa carbonis TaxID=3076075 RepID=UPI003A64A31B
MLNNYTRFMIINTGAYSIESVMPKIKEFCEKFNMQYDVTPGSLRLLRLLLTGQGPGARNLSFSILDKRPH